MLRLIRLWSAWVKLSNVQGCNPISEEILTSGLKMLTAGISAQCQTRTPPSIRYIFSRRINSREIWFVQDGAAPHFSIAAANHLTLTFQNH
jgi:hypothetical protein